MNTSILSKTFLFTVLCCFASLSSYAQSQAVWEPTKKDVVVIAQPESAKSAKSAILILPGFGDSPKKRKAQKAFFENKGHDVYIPDFHHRKSIDLTVDKLERFMTHHQLESYESVHVYSYILGAWVLNQYLAKTEITNIKTIIYDRSPLQERAPKTIVARLGLVGRMLKGKVLKEMSLTPYTPMTNDAINVGIIIECKATKIIKIFKRKALSYGPIVWDPAYLKQAHNDAIYVPLDHNEMYTRFDVIGTELLYFIEHGAFPSESRRTKWDFDPFEKVDLEELGF